MKNIETLEEFEQMLALDKCLVFVAADWSSLSKMAEAATNLWNKINDVAIFKTNIDAEVFHDWFAEQEQLLGRKGLLTLGGNGSLLFVHHGVVIEHIWPNRADLGELARKAQEFF
jgi:hypothetical protein